MRILVSLSLSRRADICVCDRERKKEKGMFMCEKISGGIVLMCLCVLARARVCVLVSYILGVLKL